MIICIDSTNVYKVAKKFKCECVVSKNIHLNGTTRIAEEAKNHKAKLIVKYSGR